MFKITNHLKDRFCKDNSIPIRVFDEPYFSDKLKAFEKTHNALSKWEAFCNMLNDFNSEEDYLAYYVRVKEQMIAYIKESKEYEVMSEFKCLKPKTVKTEVYQLSNIGKKMVSLDIIKANFSVLKAAGILKDFKQYEDFVGSYTDYEYIKESKYIRQVVFGNCNCKKQINLEQYYTTRLYDRLVTEGIPEEMIINVSNDEIVLDFSADVDGSIYNILTNIFSSKFPETILFRLDPFKLEGLMLNDKVIGYAKIHDDGKFELKHIEGELASLIYKLYQHIPLTESDFVVVSSSGFLAKILNVDTNTFKIMSE